MLKVYNVMHYVSVDGGKWCRVESNGQTMIDDSEVVENVINGSFEHWCEYLQARNLPGMYYKTTLFKKKPCIVTYSSSYDSVVKHTHFKNLSYKTVYKELEYVSLGDIINRYPADQAIQYLKERGINTCPIIDRN